MHALRLSVSLPDEANPGKELRLRANGTEGEVGSRCPPRAARLHDTGAPRGKQDDCVVGGDAGMCRWRSAPATLIRGHGPLRTGFAGHHAYDVNAYDGGKKITRPSPSSTRSWTTDEGDEMGKLIRNAVTMLLLMTVITGVAYPLLVTGLAQVLFPAQANGSLVMKDGKPVGSALIGQAFTDPQYFWGRPSATAPMPYNGASSGGSNLGPSNPALADAVRQRIAALQAVDPGNGAPVPVDLVSASASGLDPDISPAAAQYQVARVARARNVSVATVQALVAAHLSGRQFGVLGEPRVNVLRLNLALDALQGH